VTYRDDEAWKARLAVLEREAAEVPELRERLAAAEARVRELEAALARFTPPPPRPPATRWPPIPPLPAFDLGDPEVLAAQQGQEWATLVELLHRHATAADRGHRIAALLRVAVVSEEELADVDGAVAALGEVLAIDPASELAFARLYHLLDGAERHDELCALLERRIGALWDASERVRLLGELARRRRDVLGDADGAEDALRRARALGG
jgi:hypothetical protein